MAKAAATAAATAAASGTTSGLAGGQRQKARQRTLPKAPSEQAVRDCAVRGVATPRRRAVNGGAQGLGSAAKNLHRTAWNAARRRPPAAKARAPAARSTTKHGEVAGGGVPAGQGKGVRGSPATWNRTSLKAVVTSRFRVGDRDADARGGLSANAGLSRRSHSLPYAARARRGPALQAIKSLDTTISGLHAHASLGEAASAQGFSGAEGVGGRTEVATAFVGESEGGSRGAVAARRRDAAEGGQQGGRRDGSRRRWRGAAMAASPWHGGNVPPQDWTARGVTRRVNGTVKMARSMRGPLVEELVRAAARVEGSALRQGSLGAGLTPTLSQLTPEQLSALCMSSTMPTLPAVQEEEDRWISALAGTDSEPVTDAHAGSHGLAEYAPGTLGLGGSPALSVVCEEADGDEKLSSEGGDGVDEAEGS